MDIPHFTRNAKLTLAILLLEALVIIALEAAVAGIFANEFQPNTWQDVQTKSIAIYLIIFISSQIFQFGVLLQAIWTHNTIQLFAFNAMNVLNFAYAIFQYSQMLDITNSKGQPDTFTKLNPLLIAIIVAAGVSEVVLGYFSYRLYREFDWDNYKKIGADPNMKRMFRSYQILVTLLKLDVFFFIVFSVQFLALVLKTDDPEFAITIVAIPAVIIFIAFAIYGARNENRYIMFVFFLAGLCAIAYFCFKLARIYTRPEKVFGSSKYLTFFASITLFLVSITLLNSVVCYLNFDKGLKKFIMTSSGNADDASVADTRTPAMELEG